MQTQHLTQTRIPTRLTSVQIIVGVQGMIYLLISLALLFAPEWFFRNIGPFPPFNRHYMGDTGAFSLTLALGLLWASRAPAARRGFVGIAGVASLVHLGNHLYDDVLSGAWSLSHFAIETLPLLLLAISLLWAWRIIRPNPS